jgi:hypothetical protein
MSGSGVGVGVGVGEDDRERLYRIWPNATEVTNNATAVVMVIRAVISRSRLD